MAKENKFTRSVLERLEQEQQKHKEIKEKPVEPPAKEPVTSVRAVEESVIIETKEPPATSAKTALPSEKRKRTPAEKQVPDLSQFLSQKEERVAKNKTFYLDQEVIDGLHQAAKAQKMTDSRLVNEILRTVLGIL